MLHRLRNRFATFSPVDYWPGVPYRSEAAVLIPLTDHNPDPHVILTRRSELLTTHRGEVAFPGGRVDPEDADTVATALRESLEEIALSPEHVEVIGQLNPMVTRFGTKVTPIVGVVPVSVMQILQANPHEIESIFQVPLSFFLRDERLRTDRGTINGHHVAIPCWGYQGYEIWGATAAIIADFLNQMYDANIDTGMNSLSEEARKSILDPAQWKPWEA